MKIIEGTPQEINEYLKKQDISEYTNREIDRLISKPKSSYSYRDAVIKETLKGERHWSSTKLEWVAIKNMDSSYILNTIKKMFRSNPSNEWLLREDEFKSLILNLADKIIEQ
jgi:hypothetical protein